MTPRALFTIVTSVVALAIAGTGRIAHAQQDLTSHPWIGNEVPAFDLPRVDGGELSLADLKGNYVVVHFGASW